jgi:acyl-CoA reductase-like NAD-dependent aldehyde dehydrogenase
VAGAWRTGGGQPIASIDPATDETLALVGSADAEDLDAAVAGARAAMERRDWAGLLPHQRARLLHRMADLIEADIETIAELQMRDNGKTLSECRGQAASAAATFRYYAAVCETEEGEVTPPRGPYTSMALYEPVGVVAAITPWNSPLTLEAQKLAPILAAGNAVILKPSEVTPLIGLTYARLAEAAGFPPGVVNVITGGGALGQALVEHNGIDMVSFTGGGRAGRKIAAAAGAALKPVVLELGGKSPNIVFADSDTDAVALKVADAIFSGAGQSCVAGSRIFVEQRVFDSFCSRLTAIAQALRIGPPERHDSDIGPLVSMAHRQSVADYVALARIEGGTVLAGGTAPEGAEFAHGAYFRPTVIVGLSNTSRTCREEIFGPVAIVLPFKDEDELVALANDSDFGLAGGIWTRDFARAWRIAHRLKAGTVWINTYKQLSISTPFGGIKQSGLGREKGRQGLRLYQQSKAVIWDAS